MNFEQKTSAVKESRLNKISYNLDGNLIKEHLQRWNITNENNWSCETYSIALQAIKGEISLVRNTSPSLKLKK